MINAFLLKENQNFTAKQSFKADKYIQKHWTKFCSFVDEGLKNKQFSGVRIKLNHYYDEQRRRNDKVKEELLSLSEDERTLINQIKKYDDITRFSKVSSYLMKTYNVNLPANGEGVSRNIKILPKIQFIISNGWKDEIILHLKN